ncbi:MAG TPA: hypothetical protein VIT45_07780 [Allosphingosinicella sp.]
MRPAGLLLALVAAAPVAARDPEPLTRSELTTLSEEALARRIFGPLGADLYVSNMTREVLRRWEGGSVWFWTKPRRDWLRDGLCVADRMMVHLAPDRLAVGDNPVLHIAGVETETVYIVRDPKMATKLTGFEPDERSGQDEACAKLDPRRDSIPAESGWQLMTAFELMKKLGDGARAGRAPVPIDCRHIDFGGPAPESEAECLTRLSPLGESSVRATADCADPIATDRYCIRVQTYDRFLYFILRSPSQELERIVVQGMEDTSAIQ